MFCLCVCDAAEFGKWTQEWKSSAGDNCPEEVRKRVSLPDRFTETELVDMVRQCDLTAAAVGADSRWEQEL